MLSRRVYAGYRQLEDVEGLKEAIVYSWERLTSEKLSKLFESMPRHLADVINKHVAATKY